MALMEALIEALCSLCTTWTTHSGPLLVADDFYSRQPTRLPHAIEVHQINQKWLVQSGGSDQDHLRRHHLTQSSVWKRRYRHRITPRFHRHRRLWLSQLQVSAVEVDRHPPSSQSSTSLCQLNPRARPASIVATVLIVGILRLWKVTARAERRFKTFPPVVQELCEVYVVAVHQLGLRMTSFLPIIRSQCPTRSQQTVQCRQCEG